jgi:hypothetical protein
MQNFILRKTVAINTTYGAYYYLDTTLCCISNKENSDGSVS